jgi:hypothetical protein
MWKPIAAAVVVATTLTACQSTGDALKLFDDVRTKGKQVGEDTLDQAAKGVDKYCDTAPEDVRMWLREELNSRTEKGDVEVDCAE